MIYSDDIFFLLKLLPDPSHPSIHSSPFRVSVSLSVCLYFCLFLFLFLESKQTGKKKKTKQIRFLEK